MKRRGLGPVFFYFTLLLHRYRSAYHVRMLLRLLIILGFLTGLFAAAPVQAAKIRYEFKAWEGPDLRVYASRPAGLAQDRPVVIVMHGTRRNADEYRDQWHALSLEYDFLLLVPEFNDRDFPGSNAYNLGYIRDSKGRPRPEQRWAYSAIEPLFDDAVRRFGMATTGYSLYGHSAGAQFVHRFLFHAPDVRVRQAVAANAGWYTMPDPLVDWPYGVRGSRIDDTLLAKAMNLPLAVLLGDQDTDPRHDNLRRTPEALKQGAHRMARGRAFFEMARSRAEQFGWPFRWRLMYVPGVDHDNARMAPAAVPFLLDLPPSGSGAGSDDAPAEPVVSGSSDQQIR